MLARKEVNHKKSPVGISRVRHIPQRDGEPVDVPLEEAVAGDFVPDEQIEQNLVLNDGRDYLARMLQPDFDRHINRLILGDGEKSQNPVDLSDTSLARQIEDQDGNPAAIFQFSDSEIHTPGEDSKLPANSSTGYGSTGSVSINNNNETIVEDGSVDYIDLGVEPTDQVQLDVSPGPVTLQILEVVSSTKLRVHNPSEFTSASVNYRIDSPGTQILFSKKIGENEFPYSDFGPSTIIHEAGLLFDDGTLFNRVLYNPGDDDAGVLVQPSQVNNTEIAVRIEFLITM